MTSDPHRLAVAFEEAVKALQTRAKLAGVTDPETFAREFVEAMRHQGWRPFAPVTALPPKPPFGTPPTPTFLAARAQHVPRRRTDESEQR